MRNKKAQIGETMTWIVATIIIIIILAISIFLTNFVINSDKTITYSADRQKNLIATKSTIAFLQNKENSELLNNKDYSGFEKQAGKLLEILPRPLGGGVGGWNFELYEDDEGKIIIHNYRLIPNIGQYNYFENNILLDKIKLRLWFECQGTCR